MSAEPAGHVAHHFEDAGQQHEAATLGMWIFLGTELMFFGGLFCGYVVYRSAYPEAFVAGSHHLIVPIAGLNTLVLLTSSLTMALAVYAAQVSRRAMLVNCLWATVGLAVVFLGLKSYEYYVDFREGLIPGPGFNAKAFPDPHAAKGAPGAPAAPEVHDPAAPNRAPNRVQIPGGEEVRGFDGGVVDPASAPREKYAQRTADAGSHARRVQIFFLFYYVMTGVHALHMIIGIGIMLVLVYYARRGQYHGEYYFPIETAGLYWHFVDLVWIFLLPLLYLVAGTGAH